MTKDIAVYSELISRLKLSQMLGQSYEGQRDVYKVFGYPKDISVEAYELLFRRLDLAAAIVNRPIEKMWKGDLLLIESKDDQETQAERAWKTLLKEFQLKSELVRLDKLTTLSYYGVLLIGFNDITIVEDYSKPVKGTRKLLYLRSFDSEDAKIKTWQKDPKNPRYGKPESYEIKVGSPGGNEQYTLTVHHTRVIHVVQETLKSSIIGIPYLEKVFNRLKDLEKLVGGSAEMFWRGARPGYQGVVDKDYQMSDTLQKDAQDQITEFENDLRRILINEGMEMKALEMQIADPASHVDIQIQMISAATGIPKRILVGSERGELSSSQDADGYHDMLQTRREEYAEPQILHPFIDRLVEYGVLPKPKEEYNIGWTDLFAPSDKDKAEVGRTRATALKEYASQPGAEYIVPPDAFFEFFLGLDQDQINLITEMREALPEPEEEDFEPQPTDPNEQENEDLK